MLGDKELILLLLFQFMNGSFQCLYSSMANMYVASLELLDGLPNQTELVIYMYV